MNIERKYCLRKLRNAYGDLVGAIGEGSAAIDLALYDAVAGGMYWPEFSSVWRAGASPGIWREPLPFSREAGAAIALVGFALPRVRWALRDDGDIFGAFANVYSRGASPHVGIFSRHAATVPMALCKSVVAALIEIAEEKAS